MIARRLMGLLILLLAIAAPASAQRRTGIEWTVETIVDGDVLASTKSLPAPVTTQPLARHHCLEQVGAIIGAARASTFVTAIDFTVSKTARWAEWTPSIVPDGTSYLRIVYHNWDADLLNMPGAS